MLTLSLASADDQCVLNVDGMLKDASEITFYLDADSVTLLVPGPSDAPAGMYDSSYSTLIIHFF